MARTVVLLEGVSDIAALRALAPLRAVDLAAVDLVDLRGVTNVRRALTELRQVDPDTDVVGLCDAAETRFVERALESVGLPVRDPSDLAAYGFFVCEADLEDELIRALGTDRVLGVIERLGLLPKLRGLQQQPAWVDRPLAEQLHRFCGVASGRKEQLAGALAAELAYAEVPEPLRHLLDRLPVRSG